MIRRSDQETGHLAGIFLFVFQEINNRSRNKIYYYFCEE
ncbi:hypothetical protein ECARS42123_4062 [Escherichia coli ARS4.2123]|nr:hypothetical protein ECARS42123_4062 [Escherichia coli ARS4.2123]